MGAGASICGGGDVSLGTVTCRTWTGTSTDGSLAFPELSAAGDHGIPSLQAKPDFAICMSGGTACAPYAPITSSASAAAEAATFTHIPISVAVVLAHSRPESFNPEISRVINVNPRLEHGLQVA